MDKNLFKLRKVVKGHETDIRCIASLPDGGFVTGSRDFKAKVYFPIKGSNDFKEVQCFKGPTHFVSSICVLRKENGEIIIYVGSNDANIYSYSLDLSEPISTMMGHSGTVCALNSSVDGNLISGSWDQTSHVWKDNKTEFILKGHSASVWATAFIEKFYLTGSADKTIRLWNNKGECKTVIEGHTDCVRALVVLSDSEFLSTGNDATIRRWNITGESLGIYYGHDNFIYSLARIQHSTSIQCVSCSEDRSVIFWNNGESVQKIRLPSTTLWSITNLTNGDFAVGSSDGRVYIFTRNESLIANPEEQKALEEEIAKTNVPISEIGDFKVNQLPDMKVLLAPGTKEGQTKLVRDGNSVCVYQWSILKNEWLKVGDVVGAAGENKDPSQKTLFEGKEYDYVFSVDIEDGMPPLKLPYNIGDNPYEVAQKFIHSHNLSQLYLDQIANFIVKNSQAQSKTIAQSAGNLDPFTGGSSYHAGANSNGTIKETRQKGEYFPQKEYVFFESANIEGITKKLKEFVDHVPPEVKLSIDDMKSLLALTDTSKPITQEQIALIKLLISWPKAYIFPALDLLRLAILLPKVNEELCASKDSTRLIDTLLVCATDHNSAPNQLLALKTLCNLFKHQIGELLILTHFQTISRALSSCPSSANKNIQIALSTLYLNYAILLNKDGHTDNALKIEWLVNIISTLKPNMDLETQFRLMVALGTLLNGDTHLIQLVKSDDLNKILNNLTSCVDPVKVGKCAKELCNLLR